MVFDIIYLCVYAAVSILLCVSIKNIPVMPYNDEAGSAYWNKIKDKSEEIGESEYDQKRTDEELNDYLKALGYFKKQWEQRAMQSREPRRIAHWFYITVIVAAFPYERLLLRASYTLSATILFVFFGACELILIFAPENKKYFSSIKTGKQLVDSLLDDIGRADPLKKSGDYPDYHSKTHSIVSAHRKYAEENTDYFESQYSRAYSGEVYFSYPALFVALFSIIRFSFASSQYL